jgi:hypothetical protein
VDRIVIAAAGNTMAPALSVLHKLGYQVRAVPAHPSMLQAENASFKLLADDPMQLLALATIAAHRGADWRATDVEINALTALDGN